MTGAIIQARMNSGRLPGKVLAKIEGKTVLEHVIERVKRSKIIEKVVLAIPEGKGDDALEEIARKASIEIFRGQESDLLDRFYQAAKKFSLDPVVRITGDCPLIDPEVIDQVTTFYFQGDYDYVSNVHPPTFPDGLDVEVIRFSALERSWKEAALPEEREHVNPYILKHPEIFKRANFENPEDFSQMRLTLDEKDDLILISEIYKFLYPQNPFFGLKEILELFRKKPELFGINRDVKAYPVSRWKRPD